MSSLVKIPLVIVAAFGTWYALTPPQPPPGAQERVKSDGVERSFGCVVRIHALVWKVRPALCSGARVPVSLIARRIHAHIVFCPCESPCRAHRLSFRRVVAVIVALPLLLQQANVTSTVAVANVSGTAHCVCAWMLGDGLERHVAPRMLQNARLALHV
jgi:hypothetical protein